MKRKSVLFALMSLALFTGCSSSSTTTTENSDKELKSMENGYSVIKRSDYPNDMIEYGEGEKAFLVYHSDTQSDVESFISEYEKLTGDTAPEFAGNMIIAKSGTKHSGGHGIAVESVKDTGRYTEVTLNLSTPGEGCITTQALTNPYLIVALLDDYKEVTFIEKNITVDCD